MHIPKIVLLVSALERNINWCAADMYPQQRPASPDCMSQLTFPPSTLMVLSNCSQSLTSSLPVDWAMAGVENINDTTESTIPTHCHPLRRNSRFLRADRSRR